MRRHEISDEQWVKIKGSLPGKAGVPGRAAEDNRLFIEAVCWIVRTGAPWRDPPERFGEWNSVFQRFNRCCKRGAWGCTLEVWQDPDLECLMLDSTTIRAHQHAAGAIQKGVDEALGRSRGGFSTKLLLAVDAEGRPLELTVIPGQEHDNCQAPRLLADHEPPHVIADKGYDCDELVRHVEKRGGTAVIPSRSGRITPRRLLKRLYRRRNHAERFVSRIKHFRRVATRYEKTARNFLGLIKVAALFSWLPNVNTT